MQKKIGATKKRTKKRKAPKETSHKPTTKNPSDVKVEKVLVENFVSLQKVMTNLSVKFDNLTTQISKLLELFEISAKTLAQKDFDLSKIGQGEKEMANKIDSLLEQNKTIARGLTLLHEQPTSEQRYYQPPVQRPQIQRPPLNIPQQIPQPKVNTKESTNPQNYQKSLNLKNSSNFLSEETS